MKGNFFFSYRLFVWLLIITAFVMGGGYLAIAYTHNLQKEATQQVDHARLKVNTANEMEIELVRLRGFTLTYLVDKSQQWHDSIKASKIRFIIYLERARMHATSQSEVLLIQQISALFANYEQSINSATILLDRFQFNRANALILHAAKDLLDTIEEKSRDYINMNRQVEAIYQFEITQTSTIILRAMIILGIGGTMAGLLLGWIISRMVFSPINQLILQVRGASGGTYLEKLQIPRKGDLEELGNRIHVLIDRINKAQEQINKNKELLQYSNKYAVLGKIAPTVAHEIRNPLAAIKMLAYSMNDSPDFPEVFRPDLSIIAGEIDRMDGFIRNFLKFAKPPDPVFINIDPVVVLHEVITLLKPKLKSSMITLNDLTFFGAGMVLADSSHLKQLYMNLLINAIEVMPEGGELTIATRIQNIKTEGIDSPNEKYLRIDIEDTGPGIPAKILNNLFEPFMKGTEHGVGLGLSISQNIANIHKGWIEGANKKGGAVFSVLLPLTIDK